MLRDPPLLLLITWAAFRALRPACIVLAHTLQYVGVCGGVCRLTRVRVTVAHAATSDTDVFNTIEVLVGENGVLH